MSGPARTTPSAWLAASEASFESLGGDEVLRQWSALASGGWSMVDRFDRGGRRYLVALRADPRSARPLSARERQVCDRVARGESNKVIAYGLGLALSTVAGHLASAREKLGVASRVELIESHLLFTQRAE